jgi:hypothetical protein
MVYCPRFVGWFDWLWWGRGEGRFFAFLWRAKEKKWRKKKKRMLKKDNLAKMDRANNELFTLTYGAIVSQLLKDFDTPAEVSAQLDKMG